MNGERVEPESAYGKQLWETLPRVYREHDRQGDLARYLDACGALLDRVHETLRQRLRDTSPETCQEWLIPYFADLLDVRIVSPDIAAQRLEVENAVLWRKWKGTARALEALAEAILQTEVEYHEGFRRVALTPRVDAPLLPESVYGVEPPLDRSLPSEATRHPGLPVVTPDFRKLSTAVRAPAGSAASKVSRFPRHGPRGLDESGHPLPELERLTWRQANLHGVPRVPDSYQDVTRRTPDLRTPTHRVGHVHPRRVLVFARPPRGFFEHSPELELTSLDELDRSEEGNVITYRPPLLGGRRVGRATLRGTFSPSPSGSSTASVHRLEDVNFVGELEVEGVRIELVRVAVERLAVRAGSSGSVATQPLVRARDCLFGSIEVAGYAELEYCTVLDRVAIDELAASDCLFMARLVRSADSTPPEIVCLRYSRVDLKDLEILEAGTSGQARCYRPSLTSEPARFMTEMARRPASEDFAVPGRGVLHPSSPCAILGGAEDGGELGAFHHRHYALGLRALTDKLREFLPVGQTAVVVYDPSFDCAPPEPTLPES